MELATHEVREGLSNRCVTCPPDARAEDLWCSWEAWYGNP